MERNSDHARVGTRDHGVTCIQVPVGVHDRREEGHPFVVITGKATVEMDEGESLLFLRPGSLCTLPVGLSRWTVSETVELLPVTEAATVFQTHAALDTLISSARPFTPRRYVS